MRKSYYSNLKKIISILVLLAIFFVFFLFRFGNEVSINDDSRNKLTKIGITQIVPHPSLDKIRQGIIDTVKKFRKGECKIDFRDAQGSITIATQIAQKFVGDGVKLIIPITTPSAQTAYAVSKGIEDVAVIFSGITDPVEAKLLSSEEVGNITSSSNITGVTDKPDIVGQVQLIRDFFPNLKPLKIGIIYNSSEVNATTHSKKIGQEATNYGMEVLYSTVTNIKEISQAVEMILDKVDLIFLPNDNTIISGLDSVLKITDSKNKPVFASDPESVERGCLVSLAPDQYAIGCQTGMMAIKFLEGININKISVENPKKYVVSVNLKVARRLNIEIPDSVLKKAEKSYS
jgi:putative tryptophan/tyrosine transport system substrate-binding protein